MAEEIAFENGRISNFEGLVTFTLTMDRVILHTAMRHASTSTSMPNFIEIEQTFCGRTDGHLRPALLGRLYGIDLKVDKDCGKIKASACKYMVNMDQIACGDTIT